MLHDARRILSLAWLGAALACGPKPAPEAPLGETKEESLRSGAAEEPEDTTPLQPAAAPSGVFVRARIKSPQGLLAAVSEAASSPVDLGRLLAEADPKAKRVLEQVIDLNGPIEGLAALHPVSSRDPFSVLSLSVRGVRAALRELDKSGVDTRQGPEGLHYFTWSDEPCLVGRSLGPSPARIVCADREESLEALQAYALRGFPTESIGDSDIAIRVLAEPLRRQYGQQLRGLRSLTGVAARQLHRDHPRFDNAVSDAVLGLVEELVALGDDLHGLDFDLWDRKGAFESQLALHLTGQSSWLVPTVLAWKERQAPAPELFRALPGSSTSAGYFRQLPKQRTEKLARVLGEVVAGGLEVKGVSRASSDKVASAVRAVLSSDRTAVYAQGPLERPSESGEKALRPAFTLWGVDQAEGEVLSILDGLAVLFQSAQLAKLEVEAELRPRFERRAKRLPSGTSAIIYEWELPARLQDDLGRDGLLASQLGGLAALGDLKRGYLAVHGAGKVTWLSIGPDLASVDRGLGAALAKGPDLTSQPELGLLLATPAVAGTFTRLASVVSLLTEPEAGRVQALLRATPHRGLVPLTTTHTLAAGERTTLAFSVRVPDEFTTDAAALALGWFAESRSAK